MDRYFLNGESLDRRSFSVGGVESTKESIKNSMFLWKAHKIYLLSYSVQLLEKKKPLPRKEGKDLLPKTNPQSCFIPGWICCF